MREEQFFEALTAKSEFGHMEEPGVRLSVLWALHVSGESSTYRIAKTSRLDPICVKRYLPKLEASELIERRTVETLRRNHVLQNQAPWKHVEFRLNMRHEIIPALRRLFEELQREPA